MAFPPKELLPLEGLLAQVEVSLKPRGLTLSAPLQRLSLLVLPLRTSLRRQAAAALRGQPGNFKAVAGHVSLVRIFRTDTVKPEPKSHLKGDYCQTGAMPAAVWDASFSLTNNQARCQGV